ncbi:cell envelope integrity protein TolA [Methylobacterium sp. HMF5984]|uniref:cell envelope integrity protein TolA n=1 Tax=Methylobacterium sp. HMF5984 TaxID=3367370 RepID=UPI003853F71E
MGAALQRVRRWGQAFLESLAAASDHKTLWFASIFTALFLHAAFVISFVAVSVSEDDDATTVKSHEISIEFNIASYEAAEAIRSSQSVDENTNNNLDKRLVESPVISSSETKYPVEASSKDVEPDAQSDGMGLDSRKDAPPREGFHFQDSNTPAQAAVDATASNAQAQNAQQTEERIRKTWEKQLVVHLARYRSYPTIAVNQNAQVTLSFVLDRSGHVVSATVARSSGEAAIDQAALTMMQRADPVPAPPASVAAKGLNFSLPIVFTLNTSKRKTLRKSE